MKFSRGEIVFEKPIVAYSLASAVATKANPMACARCRAGKHVECSGGRYVRGVGRSVCECECQNLTKSPKCATIETEHKKGNR